MRKVQQGAEYLLVAGEADLLFNIGGSRRMRLTVFSDH